MSDERGKQAVDGTPRGPFAELPRRIRLTIEYHGWRTLLFRLLTFPLRFTPLRHRLHLRSAGGSDAVRQARDWYRRQGRPVDIVIPSYEDAEHVDSAAGDGPDHRRGRLQRP